MKRPELSELMDRIYPKAGVKWHAIGLQLGIPNSKLQIIDSNARGNIEHCCREMFDEWLSEYCDATWRRLIEVLCKNSVREHVLAVQLCKWLDAPFPN